MRSSLLLATALFFVAVGACGNPQDDGGGGASQPSTSSGKKGVKPTGDDSTSDDSTSDDGGRGDDEGFPSDDSTPPNDDAGDDDTSKDPEAIGGSASGGGNGTAEVCNGLDDNRNGTIDEGCGCQAGDTQYCYPTNPKKAGIGACKRGTMTCPSSGMWSDAPCVGYGSASMEVPNGIDDNCDGLVDNGVGGAGGGSSGGPGGATGTSGGSTSGSGGSSGIVGCGNCVKAKCPLPSGSSCQSDYGDFITYCADEAPGLFLDASDGGCPPADAACDADIQAAYTCGCQQCHDECLAASMTDGDDGGEGS